MGNVQKNRKFMEELIDYLNQIDATEMVSIYCNGHLYQMESITKRESKCETSSGTVYYDQGEFDVTECVEYNNPESITMTFEGTLYHLINYASEGTWDKLMEIGAKYGQYPEQGHTWNLAFYDI